MTTTMDSHFPQTLIALPLELIDTLNQAYFLHLLANEPDKVLPPGKSLMSMLAQSQIEYENNDVSKSNKENIETKIRQVAHKAFWDEALETLSSPQPSVQLQRLRLLFSDLKDALAPLFPLNHITIQALSSPLAPTTSPLHSAVLLLKEVLLAIKQRCAPARDEAVDELLRLLDDTPPYLAIRDAALLRKRNYTIANLVIKVIQSTLALCEVMKGDLNQCVLGDMTETQLRTVVYQQAKVRERELVLKLWSTPNKPGQQVIRERWRIWVNQLEHTTEIDERDVEGKWKLRLLQALQNSMPVSCPLIPSGAVASAADNTLTNSIPPQFLFTVPRLVSVQNYMQALVVSAALCSLLRVPRSTNLSGKSPAAVSNDFCRRVWTLLAGEIEATHEAHADIIGETKIAHLADELVRARRMMVEVSAEEETRLRAAADNLLRPEDPVYVLLQRRIINVLREKLFSSRPSTPINALPGKMKTGKDRPSDRRGKRPKLDLWSGALPSIPGPAVVPKGFEDSVLVHEMGQLSLKLASCVAWVEGVWGDLV